MDWEEIFCYSLEKNWTLVDCQFPLHILFVYCMHIKRIVRNFNPKTKNGTFWSNWSFIFVRERKYFNELFCSSRLSFKRWRIELKKQWPWFWKRDASNKHIKQRISRKDIWDFWLWKWHIWWHIWIV